MVNSMMYDNGVVKRCAGNPLVGILGSATAALIAAAALGCGGSGNAPANTARSGGSLSVGVQWPAPSRLVPAGSNSIVAVLKAADGTALGQQVISRPTSPPWISTTTFNNITASSVVLNATAYPNANGTGVAQAAGSVTAAISPGQQASVTLTMASTINHITVTPAAPTISVGSVIQLTATAYDSLGSVVLTTPGKINWSVDNKAFATVDANGIVTGVSPGLPSVTAKDTESNISGSSTVTVRVFTAVHGPTLAAMLPNQNYFYVANSISKDIHIFYLNGGTLNPTLAPVSIGKYPFGMTIGSSASGYVLYVLASDNSAKGGSGNSVVFQWRINVVDGSLTPLSPASVPAISSPVALFSADTENQNFVYDVDAHNGIRSFSIGSDGSLTPLGSDLTPGQFLGSVTFQNNTNFMLGTPGGGVASFNIQGNGSLVKTNQQLFQLAEDLSSSPVSPYLFVGNDSGITPYFEANDGSFTASGTGSTSSELGKASVVNNSGAFLYAIGNFGSNNAVSQFGIAADGSLGALTPATVPCGNNPSSITLAFSGLYLYVTNSADDTISQYFVGVFGNLTPMNPPTVAD